MPNGDRLITGKAGGVDREDRNVALERGRQNLPFPALYAGSVSIAIADRQQNFIAPGEKLGQHQNGVFETKLQAESGEARDPVASMSTGFAEGGPHPATLLRQNLPRGPLVRIGLGLSLGIEGAHFQRCISRPPNKRGLKVAIDQDVRAVKLQQGACPARTNIAPGSSTSSSEESASDGAYAVSPHACPMVRLPASSAG